MQRYVTKKRFVALRNCVWCINDHKTQNQSLKQALLAFYEKFPVWKSCHFGRYFKKRSHQTDRCITRTNRYSALPESAFLMQLIPVLSKLNKLSCSRRQYLMLAWIEHANSRFWIRRFTTAPQRSSCSRLSLSGPRLSRITAYLWNSGPCFTCKSKNR